MGSERYRSKRLVLFNHKGGVGKTTLTVNLAIELAKLGKRVLLVDADPQCNLTSYLIEDNVVDDLLDKSDGENGQTVWTALKPVVDGTGDIREVRPIELTYGNLFLIPGDIRLSEFEAELNDFWSQCVQRKTRGFRGTAALSSLVNVTAKKLNADYVFYDAGPNIGPLNRVILLDCDYFVVTAACDLFSLRALSTLGRTIASWIGDWKIVTDLAPKDIHTLPGMPKVLGYILQRFRVYGDRIASQHRSFVPRIERGIKSQIVNILEKVDSALVDDNSSKRLGAIKDFGSLASLSQEEGVPLSEVKKSTPAQRREAADAFKSIALNLIERAV